MRVFRFRCNAPSGSQSFCREPSKLTACGPLRTRGQTNRVLHTAVFFVPVTLRTALAKDRPKIAAAEKLSLVYIYIRTLYTVRGAHVVSLRATNWTGDAER